MVQRLRIRDFVPRGSYCHFARTELRPVDEPHPHSHDFHEIFWIENGRGWELRCGERRDLAAGQVTLVNAEDDHAFGIERDGRCVMANLAFPVGVWEHLHRRCYPTSPDPFAQPAPRVTTLRAHELLELQDLAGELTAGGRGMATIERFLLNFMYLLERARERPTWTVPEWLGAAVARLGEPRHLHDGTQALVALCDRSAEHVAREVRRCYGKTPTDLVNEARMAHAARRLGDSQDAIIDICYECGFSNLGHFYRLFREIHRVPPNHYRERHRRIVQPEGPEPRAARA